MQVHIHALPFDPTQLPDLFERLLRSHHANNYSGAADWLQSPGCGSAANVVPRKVPIATGLARSATPGACRRSRRRSAR